MSAQDVGPLLAPTIAALQAQTLDQWELLVLDRGSIDATGALASDVAAGDPRVRGDHGLAHPAGPHLQPRAPARPRRVRRLPRARPPVAPGVPRPGRGGPACRRPLGRARLPRARDPALRRAGDRLAVRPRHHAAAALGADRAGRFRRGRLRGDGGRPRTPPPRRRPGVGQPPRPAAGRHGGHPRDGQLGGRPGDRPRGRADERRAADGHGQPRHRRLAARRGPGRRCRRRHRARPPRTPPAHLGAGRSAARRHQRLGARRHVDQRGDEHRHRAQQRRHGGPRTPRGPAGTGHHRLRSPRPCARRASRSPSRWSSTVAA